MMMRRTFAAVGLLVLCLSCGQPAGGVLADYSARQRQLFALGPADAWFGLTVADPGHVLARLEALRTAAESGPVGKKYIEQGREELRTRLGFDPLDARAWQQQGIDTSAGLAFFVTGEDKGFLAVGASDPGRTAAFLQKLVTDKIPEAQISCSASGRFAVCSRGGAQLCASEAASLWPRVSREVPAVGQGGEIAFFLPLDQGPAGADLRKGSNDEASRYFARSKSVYGALSLGEDQVLARAYYRNPDTARLRKYLRPEPGTRSLLGVGAEAHGVGRMLFSPSALWKLAQEGLEARTLDQVTGGFEMSTGLDLRKDVVENLTGESIFANYGMTSAGGLSGAWLLGTRDDGRTRHMAERLDGLAAGGLQAARNMLETGGWKISHEIETVGGRPAYTYRVEMPPGEAGQMGMREIEVRMSAQPGALVIAFDRKSLDKVVGAIGQAPSAFIGRLATAEARQAFESAAPMVAWGLSENPFATVPRDQWNNVMRGLSELHPDASEGLREWAALMELVYDTTMAASVDDDGWSFLLQTTLM